jgi:hypothetical protein
LNNSTSDLRRRKSLHKKQLDSWSPTSSQEFEASSPELVGCHSLGLEPTHKPELELLVDCRIRRIALNAPINGVHSKLNQYFNKDFNRVFLLTYIAFVVVLDLIRIHDEAKDFVLTMLKLAISKISLKMNYL